MSNAVHEGGPELSNFWNLREGLNYLRLSFTSTGTARIVA
jgi:hypothetical protein